MRECTYNLFRNKRPDLICAVPEDRPVPGFVDPDEWRFERTLRPLDRSPPGFENRAAQAGVRFNGFYLFLITDTLAELPAQPNAPEPARMTALDRTGETAST